MVRSRASPLWKIAALAVLAVVVIALGASLLQHDTTQAASIDTAAVQMHEVSITVPNTGLSETSSDVVLVPTGEEKDISTATNGYIGDNAWPDWTIGLALPLFVIIATALTIAVRRRSATSALQTATDIGESLLGGLRGLASMIGGLSITTWATSSAHARDGPNSRARHRRCAGHTPSARNQIRRTGRVAAAP